MIWIYNDPTDVKLRTRLDTILTEAEPVLLKYSLHRYYLLHLHGVNWHVFLQT